jgi:hypothetical protein
VSEFDDLIAMAQEAADDTEVLIDLSEAGDREPVTPGKWAAIVKSVDRGETRGGKNPGSPKLEFKFVITQEPFNKRVLTKHAMLTGAGAGITADIIKALGFDTTADGGKVRFSPAEAVGRRCVIEVKAGEKPEWPDIAKVHPAS